jgi:VWFA-related protein
MKELSKLASVTLASVLLFYAAPIPAQDSRRPITPLPESPAAIKQDEDVVRVNTRAVLFDVLVRDKRTGLPVKDLTSDNFQVLDNGKLRTLTYFSRESERRRPLALVFVIDAWPVPDEWLANATSVMEHFAASLGRLMPEDEVAVVLTEFGEVDSPCQPTSMEGRQVNPLRVLQGLTRDRLSVASALRAVPLSARKLFDARRQLHSKAKRLDDYRPSGILCLPDVVHQMALARPGSQVMALVITDDLNVFTPAHLGSMIGKLTRTGVPVHALVTKISPLSVNIRMGFFREAARMPERSRMFIMKDLAKETGGDATVVVSPDEYANAFERIIEGLAARYSLGFSLGENEPDDGRIHSLDIKVGARDTRGKERKLVVSTRRNYYLPRTRQRLDIK